MLSKRSAPPRPPLPTAKRTDSSSKMTGQPELGGLAQTPPKKLDFFSIRYSRDDANESDEEICIVRKEDNVDELREVPTETQQQNQNELDQNFEQTASTSPAKESTTSSILSNIPIPFLSRSSSKSSVESHASDDKLKQQDSEESSAGKFGKTGESETKSETTTSCSTNGSVCVTQGEVFSNVGSPPRSKTEKITDTVVSHAMSLSSLLKKEVENINFGGKTTSESITSPTMAMKDSAISSALVSSMFLMPLGVDDGQSDSENVDVQTTEVQSVIDVPVYNILIVSVVVFLYHILPTSSFVNGVVFGGFLTFFFVCALMWLLTPEMSDEERYKRDVLEHEAELARLAMKRSSRNGVEVYKLISRSADLEGWFFKISSPDYNPSEPIDFSDRERVIPVYVVLSGHKLTLSIPRKDELSRIKRSNMLEPEFSVKFSSTKEYDLRHGGEIELVPETITLKRVWAKKYPIYLKVFEKPCSRDETEASEDHEENFEFPTVTEEMYLFSPTSRGKEEWYYGMEKTLKPRIHHQLGMGELEHIFMPHSSFAHYMGQLVGAESEPSSSAQLTWVNAFLGRIFWDVWKSEHWSSTVKNRIQNKITRMKLPPFIRYLKVTDMRLGNALPTIQRAHNLEQNDRGIWVDLDVDYQGGVMLTLETMVNLEYYLKQLTDQGGKAGEGDEVVLRFTRDDDEYSDGSDSEGMEEDWTEASEGMDPLSPDSLSGSGDNSSSETEVDSPSLGGSEQENQGWAEKVKNPKGKKILGMLEKVAKSKWVQKAAETKVVQRAVEKFSNLPIVLRVEVVRLRGTLAANIPPPPSNRLWLGFHSGPLLSLIARPKLGERHVRLTHVTEWIEYKLKQEFKSMFVLPNMEDLTIRIMDSGLEEKFAFS